MPQAERQGVVGVALKSGYNVTNLTAPQDPKLDK